MRREPALRRRLRSLGTLSQAISAMKSLSAHHFRQARAQLSPAQAYRAGLERTLAGMALDFPGPRAAPIGLVLVASDLGVCGSYNSRLVEAARERHRALGEAALRCVGRRAASLLGRSGLTPAQVYRAPTGTGALGPLLIQLVEDLLDDFLAEKLGGVEVISARFGGVGEFDVVHTVVLPTRPPSEPGGPGVSPYVSPEHAAAVGLRELLYIRMYQLFLDALASEHGARLIATSSAADWLDRKITVTARLLRALRLENATQELLDVASGRKRRGAEELG